MEIQNGTDMDYTMEEECKYKMEQQLHTQFTISQKWNTRWNRNGIHNGTSMEYTMEQTYNNEHKLNKQ